MQPAAGSCVLACRAVQRAGRRCLRCGPALNLSLAPTPSHNPPSSSSNPSNNQSPAVEISVTKDAVKFGTTGDIGSANIMCRCGAVRGSARRGGGAAGGGLLRRRRCGVTCQAGRRLLIDPTLTRCSSLCCALPDTASTDTALADAALADAALAVAGRTRAWISRRRRPRLTSRSRWRSPLRCATSTPLPRWVKG